MRNTLVIAFCLTCFVPATCGAWGNNRLFMGTIHVRPHNDLAGCDYTIPHGEILSCGDVITMEPAQSVDAFPVFYDVTEYLACEYGLTWPSFASSAVFSSCADLTIGDIRNPGDGASHAWTTCQTNSICIPGFIWLYADSAGKVCFVPHNLSGYIQFLDCSFETDIIAWRSCAGIFGAAGDAPCPDTTTGGVEPNPGRPEPCTWGQVKGLFR
jgi:hypothetical protein